MNCTIINSLLQLNKAMVLRIFGKSWYFEVQNWSPKLESKIGVQNLDITKYSEMAKMTHITIQAFKWSYFIQRKKEQMYLR